MRVIFLGTPEFAIPSLRVLINSSYEVCAVVTQPDRPSGRGKKLQPPPVKTCALDAGIPVFQPEKIRSGENRGMFESLGADFLVVAAYGQILPGWLLKAARVAPVNVHGSLLPSYRGAAPVAWAILKGDTVSGVTTMIMQETLDTGPMLLKREIRIPENMNQGELAELLSHAGAEILVPTLDGLRNGTLQAVPQNDSEATWAPRITKEMAQISWDLAAGEIHSKIRALNPWPLAFSFFHNQKVQLFQSARSNTAADPFRAPGSFLGCTARGMMVQCGGGTVLEVLEIQPESRKRVSGRDFAIGCRLRSHDSLLSS